MVGTVVHAFASYVVGVEVGARGAGHHAQMGGVVGIIIRFCGAASHAGPGRVVPESLRSGYAETETDARVVVGPCIVGTDVGAYS